MVCHLCPVLVAPSDMTVDGRIIERTSTKVLPFDKHAIYSECLEEDKIHGQHFTCK